MVDSAKVLVDPVEMLVDPVEVLVDPVEVMVDPVEVIFDPVEIMIDPVEVMVDPLEVMVDPLEVNADLVEVMPDPAVVMPNPVEMMTDPLEVIVDDVLGIIFSYLSLNDLRNCAQVSRNWNNYLEDGNSDVWRYQCRRKLSKDVLKSAMLSPLHSYKMKLRAHFHAWNPRDCSPNICIKEDGFTLFRKPATRTTDAARTKIGVQSQKHVWEVRWTGPLGIVAMIGISRNNVTLRCNGYRNLVGADSGSWGWNLVNNHLRHNGKLQGKYVLPSGSAHFQMGDILRIILDCDQKTLAFSKNGQFLGIAFQDLPDVRLYPTVAAVFGNTEISIVYLGTPLED